MLKYEPRYDLLSTISWHSDLTFTEKSFSWEKSLFHGKKALNFRFRKWSYTELTWVSLCKFFSKLFRGFRQNEVFKNLFAHQYWKVYIVISILHKMFFLSCCLIIWWWLYFISKKKLRWSWFFGMQINIKVLFIQVNFNNLGINVSYKVILELLISMNKNSQSTQSNKFATSLQYLKKS